ncbi:tRNA dimethylallyltransferase, mitochondrial [Taxawa tesnikishii (nom. ined.)]|nr:tRNA dimethylallyltransferase, mitochondrial [Dothideales sp. JES 119]
MSNGASRLPLVVVVGATGTGKSELAVEIACKHNGEIINGDAMQLYAGLPIITNKIPAEERKGIPHHLLGCIGLDEQTWTRTAPDPGRGTHYYTQSLLFYDALADKPDEEEPHVSSGDSKWPVLEAPTEEMLAKLFEVDPVMANRWHPKDRRKIRRSLEIWFQTGRKASEIYEEQRVRRQLVRNSDGAARDGSEEDAVAASTLRMRTLVLWVNAKNEELARRLDSRVHKMVKNGLLDEVHTLKGHADEEAASGQTVDHTRGIWVAIGYKEFLEYERAMQEGNGDESRLATFMAMAVERTQIATRQYAKRQIRWIRIKFNHAITAAGIKEQFYMLDSTSLDDWQSAVVDRGVELVGAFMREEDMPAPTSLSAFAAEMLTSKGNDISASAASWFRQHCDVCNTTVVTENQWSMHVKSRKHRRAVSSKQARDARSESAIQTTRIDHFQQGDVDGSSSS